MADCRETRGAGHAKRLRRRFRRGHEAEAFEFGGRGKAAGMGGMDRDARKVGRVFVLEIHAAGDARGAAGSRIGAGALPEPSRKILVLELRKSRPCLKVSGRGFEGEKHGRGEGREPIGFEVVELDEGHAGAMRPHDKIALLGWRDERASPAAGA